jgi:hypothetical protein
MEVGQGPNVGCSAKGEKNKERFQMSIKLRVFENVLIYVRTTLLEYKH